MDKLITMFFLLSIFFLSFLPVKDTDFGWHYRCGKQFLTSGKLCIKNDFSYFMPNYQAAYPSFLYDIGLAFTYDRFGFVGVSVLGAVLLTLSAFFFIKLFSKKQLAIAMLSFIVIFLLSYRIFGLGLRSQTLTYLFFVITLFLLNQPLVLNRLSSKSILLFPIIFLVWVNTHIGFFVGLILLLFFFFGKPSLTSFFIFLLSFLATLLNPFGIKVYQEIFNHLKAPMKTMFAEWVPPSPLHMGLILGGSILAFVLIVRQKKISLFKVFSLIFFAILALQAQRNLPFFYTIFFYIVIKRFVGGAPGRVPDSAQPAELGGEHWREGKARQNLQTIHALAALISITVLSFSLPEVPNTIRFNTSWPEYCQKGLVAYPCKAVKKIGDVSGNVFSAYEWGGFLIWQTPKLKVFVDGRMSAWKDERYHYPYQEYLYIIQAREGWNKKLRKLKTDYLFIQNGTFLDLELQKNAKDYGWQESYRDPVAAFYKKILL